MSSTLITVIVVVAIIVVLALIIFSLYNTLVKKRNETDEAKAQIATQQQRRFDLIPNLIETVKGYAKHESGVFEQVTALRAEAESIKDDQKALGENMSAQQAEELMARSRDVIGGINVAVEAYPDLKASQNFSQLQEELANTENLISFARQNYNDRVLEYNNKVQTIPSNIIAGMFGFKTREMFEVENQEAKVAPKVQF